MARKPQHDDQVYDAVVEHWLRFAQPPTVQYIVDNCDLQSKSTVWAALFRLVDRRMIRMIKGKAIPAGIEISIETERPLQVIEKMEEGL